MADRIELKQAVLKRLQSASWMLDAGWTAARIEEHYRRDRNHRAAVKVLRRRGVQPSAATIAAYLTGARRG